MSNANLPADERYQVTGLTRAQANQIADLLSGGSAMWCNGKAYPSDDIVIESQRPLHEPEECPYCHGHAEGVNCLHCNGSGQDEPRERPINNAAWNEHEWLNYYKEEYFKLRNAQSEPLGVVSALRELVRLQDQYRPDPAPHEWTNAWEAADRALKAIPLETQPSEPAGLLSLLDRALKVMSDFHATCSPSENHENCEVPGYAFRVFVDDHAELLYERNQLLHPLETKAPCLHKWTTIGAFGDPHPDAICEGGCGGTWQSLNTKPAETRAPHPNPCPLPQVVGLDVDGREISPGIWGIGKVSWHESGHWRCLANVNGALCVIEVSVTTLGASEQLNT